jgi:hypothetical protein
MQTGHLGAASFGKGAPPITSARSFKHWRGAPQLSHSFSRDVGAGAKNELSVLSLHQNFSYGVKQGLRYQPKSIAKAHKRSQELVCPV